MKWWMWILAGLVAAAIGYAVFGDSGVFAALIALLPAAKGLRARARAEGATEQAQAQAEKAAEAKKKLEADFKAIDEQASKDVAAIRAAGAAKKGVAPTKAEESALLKKFGGGR